MRYKLIVFLINALFIINIVAVAAPISNDLKENKTMYFDDPVPTWSVGNSWTYTFNNFSVHYEYNEIKIFIDGRIDDFKWTVVNTDGTDYKVDLTGEITADSYEVNLPLSTKTLHITGSIKPSLTSLSGTIVFTKSDLEIKDISAEIKGIISAKISPIPFSIPIPFKVTLDGDLSTVLPIFDFPLFDDKYWNLPAIDVTSNISVGGIFGFIKYPFTLTTSYTWIPLAFHCKPKADVTVGGVTYSAYEITSTLFDVFKYYYAPSAGNLIKIDATMPNGELHGELKSTNFS